MAGIVQIQIAGTLTRILAELEDQLRMQTTLFVRLLPVGSPSRIKVTG